MENVLPFFYNNPVPLDSQKHQNISLKKNFGFHYTKGANAVSINLIEFQQICHFYPIVFSPDDHAIPVSILGLRNNENLFLLEDGTWKDSYIPAYIRRYPFIFSQFDDEQLTLSIDLVDNIILEDRSNPFFNEDGSSTDLTKGALEFCRSYHAAASQTGEFSKVLLDMELLIDQEAKIDLGQSQVNFSGFRIIDEAKFKKLSDRAFLKLRKLGFLPYIYAHFLSHSMWQSLSNMLRDRIDSAEENQSSPDDFRLDPISKIPDSKPITGIFKEIKKFKK